MPASRFRLTRVLFCAFLAAFLLPLPAFAQKKGFRGETPLPAELGDAGAQERLDTFRRQRLDGDFSLKFQLVHRPRRGYERTFNGILWGTWTERGPVTRFTLWPEDAPESRIRMLVQNGERPGIWVLGPDGKARALPPEDWQKPLHPELLYSPFDLLMPFIYWKEFSYEGSGKIKTRPVHFYRMRAPAGSPATDVQIALDAEFNALIQVEVLQPDGQPAREMRVISFKKIQNQWMLRTVDLADARTRDLDRFNVLAGAIGVKMEVGLFTPAALAGPDPKLAPERYERLD